MKPNDFQWTAIKHNDRTQDFHFWYGVKTTGIFCKPSCPSRLPKRENVLVFNSLTDAAKAGFRPCKRCRPTEHLVSNQVWVKEINHVLATHYREKLTLDKLADMVHGSPSYLRHVYKALTGMTPQEKLTLIRLSAAARIIQQSHRPVGQVAGLVGMANVAHFIQTFKHQYDMTPLQYRRRHQQSSAREQIL